MKKRIKNIIIAILLSAMISGAINSVLLLALNMFSINNLISAGLFGMTLLILLFCTIFPQKVFSGVLLEWVFTFSTLFLMAFMFSLIIFSLFVTEFRFSNFDFISIIKRIILWDTAFIGVVFIIFLVFAGIYLGFIDRQMLRFLRFTGLRGTGKLKQTEANLENSRWMEDGEKKKIFKPYMYSQLNMVKKDGVPVMAKLTDNGKDMEVLFNSPCHSIIIGSTGSGKTTTFVNPMIQLIAASGSGSSMIMTDPKGELFALHSGFLVERGYDVKVIDLRDTYSSYRWNPLDSIWDSYQHYANAQDEVYKRKDNVLESGFELAGKPEEFKSNEAWYLFNKKAYPDMDKLKNAIKIYKKRVFDEIYEDLNDLCSALVPVENEKDPMWEKGARAITLATLLAMLEDSEDPKLNMTKEKFNFFNLAKILQNSNDDYLELRKYFSGRSPLSKALSLSKQVCDAAESTRASYMSIVYEKLTMFNDSGICALTSASDFIPENLSDRPTALFLKIPDEKDTRYNLAAIFMLSIYKALIKIASSYEDLSLPRNVYYIMDEFANMPKINKFDKMITVGRSRKIWFTMIIQSYAQLNNVYGDKVADIVKGNCGIKMFIGSNDMGTCKEYSELCGNITVVTNGSSGSVGDKNVNISSNIQVRPLIYPSELQRLNKPGDIGHSIVVTFGNYPLLTYFTPSFRVSLYKMGKMDTSELNDRMFDEKAVFYDISVRNKIMTEEEDSISGGETPENTKEDIEEKEEPQENKPQNENSDIEAIDLETIDEDMVIQMWNLYKKSHPDAKIEDVFKSRERSK